MSAPLSLRLLGACSYKLGSGAATPINPEFASVLAMLALNAGRVSIARVLACLWPSQSELQAAQHLATVLRALRLEHPQLAVHLIQNQVALAWSADAEVRDDVQPFSAAILRHDWNAAIALYTGDLIEEGRGEWIVAMRQGLRLEYLYALDRLIEQCDIRQDYAQARLLANRLVQVEPARASGYQLVMRFSNLLGDVAAVRAAFERCTQAMRGTLDVEPSPATCSIYRACLQLAPNASTRLSQSPQIVFQAAQPHLHQAPMLAV